MPIEKSAGAIIFRRENNKILFLLLHYPSSPTRAQRGAEKNECSATKATREYWDLPKGHIEKGEKELDTVRREVEEETGLRDIEFVEGFKEWIKYFFKFQGKNIMKFVTFYLAEAKTKDVKISEEHLGFKWLPYEKALEKLTFKNAKDILQKANNFLRKHGIAK